MNWRARRRLRWFCGVSGASRTILAELLRRLVELALQAEHLSHVVAGVVVVRVDPNHFTERGRRSTSRSRSARAIDEIVVAERRVGIDADHLAELIDGQLDTALIGVRHGQPVVGVCPVGIQSDGFLVFGDRSGRSSLRPQDEPEIGVGEDRAG